jgi:hypothetical protein
MDPASRPEGVLCAATIELEDPATHGGDGDLSGKSGTWSTSAEAATRDGKGHTQTHTNNLQLGVWENEE